MTSVCEACHGVLWTLGCGLLSGCGHFPAFQSLDNLTPPAAGETEESRISCIMVIELVPKKRHCIAHQKGLPPILVILVPLFCEM